MKNRMTERILWIALVAVLAGTLVFQGFHGSPIRTKAQALPVADPNQYLALFQNIYMKIFNEYVDSQKADDLFHNAIDGMIKGLNDPHSALLRPKSFEELKTETKGEYGGLGIVVGKKDDKLTVISPMEDTPAEKVGLRADDRIIKINGTNVIGIALDKAVDKLRGPPGAPVTITVERDSEKAPFDVTIVREKIDIKSVKFSTISTNIGYLRVTSFSANTPDQLEKAVASMKTNNCDSLIIDLRNNPGGLLDVAIKVADMFLDSGPIVSTRGRTLNNSPPSYMATPGTIVSPKMPIVVLVNKGSASASEIFAGAMQDTKRAVLLGTQTYGKGSVQTVINLDGGYGIRLTIARYYTPADRMIDKVGLAPDINVDDKYLTKEQVDMINKLDRTNILRTFAADHKDTWSTNDLAKLKENLKSGGIDLPDALLRAKIQYEQTRKTPAYNLELDGQLREAVQIMKVRKLLDRN